MGLEIITIYKIYHSPTYNNARFLIWDVKQNRTRRHQNRSCSIWKEEESGGRRDGENGVGNEGGNLVHDILV